MKKVSASSLVLLLGAFASSVLAVTPRSSADRKANLPTVENRFIIEVDDTSNIPSTKRSTESPDVHKRLYSHLKSRKVSFDVTKEYKFSGLFVGAAITLENPRDVNMLEGAPGIKAIRPVRIFDGPKPVKFNRVTGLNDPEMPVDTQSTHMITGVDKLHAAGILGKGIKIGMLDTGIDYTHPALGGAFGPGNKVIGGFDFVGDDYDGTNTPIPDNDPLDQCRGHGTHTAGIIGANPGNDFNISGVAYEASITSYRVFGCKGSVTDDVLIDALLLGVKDGQDVLTLSISGPDGWTESASAVVASRIARSGKIVTIAAGNDGESGSWYSSNPGNGIDVISVASVDNPIIRLQNATIPGVTHDPITYFATFLSPIKGELPIYATSNDTTILDDACNPLPDSTPDLSGKLVIVRRGTCTFAQKLDNLEAKGAKVALIYDDGSGFLSIPTRHVQATLIQAADGQFLVEQFAAGIPIFISFPQSSESTGFRDPHGGLISSFTSYGPSNDFYFKPAVAAPGGNILSTFLLGGFGVASGTSTAAPFVAGSAALLLQAMGKSSKVARDARTIFEATAKRVPSSNTDGSPLQTVTQQGAGLINVFDAIYTETFVTPTELIVNDTAHAKPVQTFTVRNDGKKSKRYKLNHVPAGTALTFQPGTIFPAVGPVPLDSTTATVSISPSTFTLSPGCSRSVTARISPPQGLDASTFPVYSGFIQISDGTQEVHVTYIGLVGSLIDVQVLDNTDFIFGVPLPTILDSNGGIQEGPVNYTFVGDDVPTLLWRQTFGTARLVVDLVDPDIQVNTTLNQGQEGGRLTFTRSMRSGTFSTVKTIGTVRELNYVSRNNEFEDNLSNTFAMRSPQFSNGTAIGNGAYRLLLRALRVTGDAGKEEDYEVYLSPIIGINV